MNNKSKLKILLTAFIISLLVCNITSCQQKDNSAKENSAPEVILKDYGPAPAVFNIETHTTSNENFRTALWTGTKLQLVAMSIIVGGEVGLEIHTKTDQFLRIEEGKAKVLIGDSKESLTFERTAEEDFAIIIPAGKWHNIINVGDKPLKLYSIYSPVEHSHGTVHKTFEEAEAEEEHH